jgi:hypothetical protein
VHDLQIQKHNLHDDCLRDLTHSDNRTNQTIRTPSTKSNARDTTKDTPLIELHTRAFHTAKVHTFPQPYSLRGSVQLDLRATALLLINYASLITQQSEVPSWHWYSVKQGCPCCATAHNRYCELVCEPHVYSGIPNRLDNCTVFIIYLHNLQTQLRAAKDNLIGLGLNTPVLGY